MTAAAEVLEDEEDEAVGLSSRLSPYFLEDLEEALESDFFSVLEAGFSVLEDVFPVLGRDFGSDFFGSFLSSFLG